MATTSFRIFQKDLWDPRVDQYFKMALKAAPHFYNVSDLLAPGGLTVRIPKVGDNFTATAVGSTTGEVSNTAVSDTATTITLNRWLASKLRITDFEMATVGRSYSLRDEYAKALGQAVAQQADKEILANITSVSRTVNDTTTALGSTDLEAALAIVESYNCPIDQLTWFFSPKAYAKLRLLSETISSKFRKLRENLYETIRSEAQKWERSTTIIGTPSMVMG